MTEKEKLTLELCCKRLNITMSTLIRQSLLGKPVQHTVLVAGGGEDALNILSALLGQCGKIGGNLNQLARHFNTGGRDTEQLRAQILTELSALTAFRLDAEKAMATIKHTSSKTSDLSAAERYLTFQHNEYTGLPILDERGQPKLRENYLLNTLECGGNTFAMACLLANRKYGKNAQADDVKTHHYIISFDPRDATDNGLTLEKAQALGL